MMKKIDNFVKNINYLLILFLILLVPLIFINKVFDYYLSVKYIYIVWNLIPLMGIIYLYNIFRKKIKIGIFDILIFIFIILNLISSFKAVSWETSIYGNLTRNEGFISFLAYYMVFLCCRCLNDKKHIRGILGVFIFVGIFQFIYCFFQLYLKDILPIHLIYSVCSNMASGFIGNPNFMGSYIVLLLGFVMVKFLTSDKYRCIYFILSLIFFINILFSQSTGPFLGTVCMLLLVLIILIVKKKLKALRYVLLICSFSLSYVLMDFTIKTVPSVNHNVVNAYTITYDLKQMYRALFVRDMINYEIPEGQLNYSYFELDFTYDQNINELGSGRLMIWKNCLKIIPDYYLFGSGLNTFGIVYRWHYNEVYYDKPHNDFLQILITRGIFSLITYLIFVLMLFIKGVRSKSDLALGLAISIIGYVVQSFTNISVTVVAPCFYMLCGILVAIINMEKNKEDFCIKE